MPALEMAQETGKLVSWLKKEGEQVRKGEMLLEVETDKAVVEIEAVERRHSRRHHRATWATSSLSAIRSPGWFSPARPPPAATSAHILTRTTNRRITCCGSQRSQPDAEPADAARPRASRPRRGGLRRSMASIVNQRERVWAWRGDSRRRHPRGGRAGPAERRDARRQCPARAGPAYGSVRGTNRKRSRRSAA